MANFLIVHNSHGPWLTDESYRLSAVLDDLLLYSSRLLKYVLSVAGDIYGVILSN
jgi:hypothetical protein